MSWCMKLTRLLERSRKLVGRSIQKEEKRIRKEIRLQGDYSKCWFNSPLDATKSRFSSGKASELQGIEVKV